MRKIISLLCVMCCVACMGMDRVANIDIPIGARYQNVNWRIASDVRYRMCSFLLEIQYVTNSNYIIAKREEICGTCNIDRMIAEVLMPLLNKGKEDIDIGNTEMVNNILYTLLFPNEVLNVESDWETYQDRYEHSYLSFKEFREAISAASKPMYEELLQYRKLKLWQ